MFTKVVGIENAQYLGASDKNATDSLQVFRVICLLQVVNKFPAGESTAASKGLPQLAYSNAR